MKFTYIIIILTIILGVIILNIDLTPEEKIKKSAFADNPCYETYENVTLSKYNFTTNSSDYFDSGEPIWTNICRDVIYTNK